MQSSANIHRRHMTKGQRAMAVAMIYPEAEKAHRGKKAFREKLSEISGAAVSKARTVLAFAPGHAANVLAVAVIYPEPSKVGRGRKGSETEPFSEISKSQRAMAVAMLY